MSTEHDHIRHWCLSLTVLSAVTISRDDLETKLAAFVPLLADSFPANAFTKQSLAHVARRCVKGFPTYGELADALADWRATFLPALARTTAYGHARESTEPYKLPTPPEWCFDRGTERQRRLRGPVAADERPTPRHLTPEQLDQLNPLPDGLKRSR